MTLSYYSRQLIQGWYCYQGFRLFFNCLPMIVAQSGHIFLIQNQFIRHYLQKSLEQHSVVLGSSGICRQILQSIWQVQIQIFMLILFLISHQLLPIKTICYHLSNNYTLFNYLFINNIYGCVYSGQFWKLIQIISIQTMILTKILKKNYLIRCNHNFYTTITNQIGMTTSFQQALTTQLKNKSKQQFLRLQINAGQGCEGFTYKFKFDTILADSDYAYEIEESGSKRVAFALNGQQLRLMKGSIVDYAQQMMRQTFFVKENPNAELSCSCKTSFSPKQFLL